MSNPYDVKADTVSECPNGHPVLVTSIVATAADPVHIMAASAVVDAIFLRAQNRDTANNVTLHLVLNPTDDTDAGDVGLARLSYVIPRGSTVYVLEGELFRLGTAAYTIGAYVDSGSESKIQLIGRIIRYPLGQITY